MHALKDLLFCLKYCDELKKAFLLYNLVMMIRNSKFGQTKMEQSRCPFQNTNAMHCNVTKSASVNKEVKQLYVALCKVICSVIIIGISMEQKKAPSLQTEYLCNKQSLKKGLCNFKNRKQVSPGFMQLLEPRPRPCKRWAKLYKKVKVWPWLQGYMVCNAYAV